MADSPQIVVVLGASGKLGRALCACWSHRPPGDFGILPVVRGPAPEGALRWSPGEPAPRLGAVRAVVALWGVTPGGADLSANVTLAEQATALAGRLGAARVLHCSSAAVYGAGAGPWRETDTARPVAPYGKAKLAMEQALARTQGGPRQILLRIGNVAGADMLFGNLRPGGRITLDRFADRRAPRRSYIAPSDLARVVEALIAAPDPDDIYNVAAPVTTGMDDIARAAGADILWRDAGPDAMPEVGLNTARLSGLIALGAGSAAADHLVRDARASGIWP